MKKILFAFGVVAVMSSISSCKKCGYCSFGLNGNTNAVCQQSGPPGFTSDDYDIEKANCAANGGQWVITK